MPAKFTKRFLVRCLAGHEVEVDQLGPERPLKCPRGDCPAVAGVLAEQQPLPGTETTAAPVTLGAQVAAAAQDQALRGEGSATPEQGRELDQAAQHPAPAGMGCVPALVPPEFEGKLCTLCMDEARKLKTGDDGVQVPNPNPKLTVYVHTICFWRTRAEAFQGMYFTQVQRLAEVVAACGNRVVVKPHAIQRARDAGYDLEYHELKETQQQQLKDGGVIKVSAYKYVLKGARVVLVGDA